MRIYHDLSLKMKGNQVDFLKIPHRKGRGTQRGFDGLHSVPAARSCARCPHPKPSQKQSKTLDFEAENARKRPKIHSKLMKIYENRLETPSFGLFAAVLQPAPEDPWWATQVQEAAGHIQRAADHAHAVHEALVAPENHGKTT